jgi:hypothetical protein
MKFTVKERMYQQIRRHGEDLKALFKLPGDIDSIKLCKSILRLENRAHHLSTQYCNGDIDYDVWDIETDKILLKLDSILGYKAKNIPVFVNGDCRGYALKIKSKYILDNRNTLGFAPIYQDLGGHGILAPEFNGR